MCVKKVYTFIEIPLPQRSASSNWMELDGLTAKPVMSAPPSVDGPCVGPGWLAYTFSDLTPAKLFASFTGIGPEVPESGSEEVLSMSTALE